MINKKLGKTLALLACVSISLYPANQGRAYSGNDAMKYAEKWYNGYNTKQYYKAGKDCTNFVSQCMVAGGKKNIILKNIGDHIQQHGKMPHISENIGRIELSLILALS